MSTAGPTSPRSTAGPQATDDFKWPAPDASLSASAFGSSHEAEHLQKERAGVLTPADSRTPEAATAESAAGGEPVSPLEAAMTENAPPPGAISLAILTTLAVCYTLYAAKAILLPIMTAFLMALALRPLVRRLRKWKIPEAAAAGLILLGMIGGFIFAASQVVVPARDWLQTAPEHIETLRTKFAKFREPLDVITASSAQVTRLTGATPADKPMAVEVHQSPLSTHLAVISETGNFLGASVLVLTLAFLLLTCGDRLLSNVISLLPRLSQKKQTVELVYDVEKGVASYLFTVTAINVGLGVCTAIAMWALGMPNPLLWGVMATLFNYIPFLGAIGGSIILLLVSLLTFESPTYILLPPGAFVILTTLEGNFITPMILGRSTSLNPLVVFVALIFWTWIWGLGGAILAVPLLTIMKLATERFAKTTPIATLLSA